MHTTSIASWTHDHVFGQDRIQAGERRTLIVIVITAITMVAEITAGILFGSMALLADGLHMGSHASALAISALAYFYTRRHAHDPRFNFGTGKVNSLAGFASAVMLVLFAVVMVVESCKRLVAPVEISYNWAILVAVVGLVVNGLCLVILGGHGHTHDDHEEAHHRPDHDHEHVHEHGHAHAHDDHHHHDAPVRRPAAHQDHNLWSAYLHVGADALTSLLAIIALLAAKYFGQVWLDPFMGIVGAFLVIRWSWGLLRASGRVLLDMQVPEDVRQIIRQAIESHGDNRVTDLHIWSVGPGIYAADLAVVSCTPQDPEHYLHLLPQSAGLSHVTVQVHRCLAPLSEWRPPMP